MAEYLIDVRFLACIRVTAESPEQAIEKVAALEGNLVNLGEIDEETIVTEAAICGRDATGELDIEIVEIDGEAA